MIVIVGNLISAIKVTSSTWLMAQGARLLLVTTQSTGRMLAVYIVTFLIGQGGLHHSIAGSVEVLAALDCGAEITVTQAVRVIGLALFGNLIGGSMFVATLNYAHIRGMQSKER